MTNLDFNSIYKDINNKFASKEGKPVIGISGNYDMDNLNCTLGEAYYRSVIEAGGIPVIIPPEAMYGEKVAAEFRWNDLLDRLDGIIFSGGADPNPLLFGDEPLKELGHINPQRDMQELLLIKLAYDRQIPILGICRGIQLLNAALGGTLYQDIYVQRKEEEYEGKTGTWIRHSQDLERGYPSHTIKIKEGSIVNKLFGCNTLGVNSFHHQACKDVAPCLDVTARSCDGIIEAVESNEFKSVLGVQWHPEAFIMRGNKDMMPIFEWIVNEAADFKKAKELHKRVLTLDSHCDTPMIFGPLSAQNDKSWGEMFAERMEIPFRGGNGPLVDLHKMTEGHLDSTIMVAYLKQQERDEASLLNATAKANQILTQIEKMVAANCTCMDIAYTPADLWRLKAQGKKAVMLGIENGYAIGKDINNVEAFRKHGVVYMTLCHNGDNDICGSCKPGTSGVTEFGAEVIKEMNRVGMMVDLSHASEQSFYDALEISSTPIVCSHSSARVLCDHPRNLTDEQMKALADRGGVAQVTMYHGFLSKDSHDYALGPIQPNEATILTAIEHLNHMVNVMGIEHVGIGTDFDGDGGIRGCACASELINFTRRLMKERYSEEQIQMIWGGNFLRLMEEVQRIR